jgi:GrpB-like predicted nucleotidyltransferase (UPF0157 family)
MVNMRNKPSSIGLRRGVVQLRESDPAWAEAFRAEAAWLTQQVADAELPPLLFEHIGSTSVPGLESKPIIDFMAGHPREVDPRTYFPTLEAAGYESRGPQGMPEREFFVRGPEQERTHHLNAALKRRLAAAHREDRGAYTEGKSQFVLHIIHGGLVPPTD